MTTTDPTAGNPSPGEGTPATETQNHEGQPATDAAKPEGEGTGGDSAGDAGNTAEVSFDELTMPDGGALSDDLKALFTEKGLTAEEAQKVIDGLMPRPPEAYEFTVPEGFTLEGERLEKASTLFKELNLSQPQAQKLVEAFCELSAGDAASVLAQIAQGDNATIDAVVNQRAAQRFAESFEATKQEFGDKFDTMTEKARGVVQHFAALRPSLLEKFTDPVLGLGNDPDLLFVFSEASKFMTTGSQVDGVGGITATGTQPKSDGDVMYAQATKVERARPG
jgi:hypothetical protein